jgi:hypothetical protein
VDWEDIRVALAALEESGYFKLESEDREAKTKNLAWRVCVDSEGITVSGGLRARKMSAATRFSIPKKPTGHVLRKARQQTPQGSKTSTQRM